MQSIKKTEDGRLVSLDFFRGITMLLLVSGGALQYFARPEFDGLIVHDIFIQFTHPHWEGFRFWDLIQPFFMFIVGVAIPYSIANRAAKGQPWEKQIIHAARRSVILILLGVTLMLNNKGFSLTFQNVLAQIGFTYFITFLLIRTKPSVQVAVSVGLILLNDILYRLFPADPGQPFVIGKTFGDLVNQVIAPGTRDNWASFNAIPTTAHTIWGALCGQLLLSKKSNTQKLKTLIIGGLVILAIGYVLTPFVPIIKRISTSSFVFVSGGWTILALAFSYWFIDLKNNKKWTKFAVIVGLNPIFIYLFSSYIKNIAFSFLGPWINLIFSWTSQTFVEFFMLLLAWLLNWYVCYFLYKNKVFIKI